MVYRIYVEKKQGFDHEASALLREATDLLEIKGLEKILLDIDKAVEIIRNTELESEVVPNLMIGFGIDEIQANFVAEIKLRNINKEYILKRTQEVDTLEDEIADLEDTVNSPKRIQKIIIGELEDVKKKYGQPRRSQIIYTDDIEAYDEEDEVENYNARIYMTREGYFKKITPQSLRMSGEHKLKEDDRICHEEEASNKDELLFFSNKFNVYKMKVKGNDATNKFSLGFSGLQTKDGEKAEDSFYQKYIHFLYQVKYFLIKNNSFLNQKYSFCLLTNFEFLILPFYR